MSPGLRFVLPALLIGVFACSDQSATAPRPPLQSLSRLRADGELTVMTYNIYQGTELENSIAATTPQEFVIGATMDFLMMRQTNFAERSTALAAEIDATQPDLIGLQEVALWRTGPHTDPAQRATNVEQDFLAMLLDALRARGLSYSIASSIDNFDVQGPAMLSPGVLTDVRLTDRDVILARTDQSGQLKLSNPHASNFVTNLVIPTVAGPTTVLEGWVSIDFRFRGRTMRFITTHLDANAPPIRLAQANEILNGPANTDLPVILAGDMNTTSTTDTYSAITAAGFSDVWARLHPADAGFTCCQTVSAINNPISALYQRVDLVLLRGDLIAGSIARLGANPQMRTASGLWPSDHAGLVATLEFEKND